MKKLIVSTNNNNKIKEIEYILKGIENIEVLSKADIGLGHINIEENGKTLEDNSIIKAKTISEKTEHFVMADDSGLFVDYLKGEPGVYSSRYAGEEGNDMKNNIKLLKELNGIDYKNRTARFKTVITLIDNKKNIFTFEGVCEGHIIEEERGLNGFGYDPLFIPLGYNKTFAELGDDIKNKISHRSKALEKFRKKLMDILGEV